MPGTGLMVTLAFLAATASVLYIRRILSKRPLNLPPGPPADPLIGHLRLIPTEGQDVFFYELGKKYGDVMHLSVLGQSMIILNSVEAAEDLLEKRSSIYSDRPNFPIYDLIGISDTLVFLKYGKEFRAQRRMIQQYFTNTKRYERRPLLKREGRALAFNLVTSETSTDGWSDSLLQFATTTIIEIGYGHRIVSEEDPHFKLAKECCKVGSASGPPGSTPVDIFPFLRYLPSWFPGTYYAHYARKSFRAFKELREYPFAQVTAHMAKGTAQPSFLLTQLDSTSSNARVAKDNIETIKAAAMILFIAGTDTTSASLAFFVLAMVLYPECQARAQEEIEAVIGVDRLPDFEDRARLPYVECLMQETLRWNQASPMGTPHYSTEDDVYRGMFIPKGSVIVANIRGMTLDSSIYKDPFNFDPTRYLPTPAGRGEPFSTSNFGFGRRICPGRFSADDSLWIAIVTILATGKVLRALDAEGKEIVPDATPVVAGIISRPNSFQCRFEPRTKLALELLKQSSKHSNS